MVKTISMKRHWKQSSVHWSSEGRLHGSISLILCPSPCGLSYSSTGVTSVSWRVSFSSHLPTSLSVANSISYFRCWLTDLQWSLLIPHWRVNPCIMCFKPFCTPMIIQINLIIYFILVFLVRWWALWGQRLHFPLTWEHQCPASVWFTPNTGFLTEIWILEKTGVAPSPPEWGTRPHPHTTLAPLYPIRAQHCGCVPAGTRKCWNMGDFSDRDRGSDCARSDDTRYLLGAWLYQTHCSRKKNANEKHCSPWVGSSLF